MFGDATEVDLNKVTKLFEKEAEMRGKEKHEAVDAAKKEFKRADKNEDGKVSKAELEAYYKAEDARQARAEAAK
eukprot:CAMPEP_0170465908 /NCGR_PEP_ID=MMETSP0123-20130129/10071_1 /TAXON_ID=182087 /ORGANISM="Favella ehrenbergii, Strain Fehren 1" /LENGTH=73 /DNA_ID=CAMNT_0010731913 /DNA_START=142 /DNA_END=363 /DNA_ORIENTATION=+